MTEQFVWRLHLSACPPPKSCIEQCQVMAKILLQELCPSLDIGDSGRTCKTEAINFGLNKHKDVQVRLT